MHIDGTYLYNLRLIDDTILLSKSSTELQEMEQKNARNLVVKLTLRKPILCLTDRKEDTILQGISFEKD